MKRNWILYLLLLLVLGVVAYVTGERLLYVALAVLTAMPLASLLMTFILLWFMRVTQKAPAAIVKGSPGTIALEFNNVSPSFFNSLSCTFFTDDFAVDTEVGATVWLTDTGEAGYIGAAVRIPFTVKYRGVFNIGLKTVQAADLMGLFRLTRRMNKKADIHALPRAVEFDSFPIAGHLLTQAHSRYDIKDEDYATISDIRPYLPTDSIKRVHWKLTAKRNEWLVKNFQSNALNKITLVLDSAQLPLRYKEQIILEDRIVETALGLANLCLRRGMPVELFTGQGHRVECQNPAAFEYIYQVGSQLAFAENPTLTSHSMLTHCLNEASGYLNMLVLTPRLDAELYERILNGKNNGHYIAVLYFSTIIKDVQSEDIYRLLTESGAPAFRIDESTLAEKEKDDGHV